MKHVDDLKLSFPTTCRIGAAFLAVKAEFKHLFADGEAKLVQLRLEVRDWRTLSSSKIPLVLSCLFLSHDILDHFRE